MTYLNNLGDLFLVLIITYLCVQMIYLMVRQMFKRFFILQLYLLAYTLFPDQKKTWNFSYCTKYCQTQLFFMLKRTNIQKKNSLSAWWRVLHKCVACAVCIPCIVYAFAYRCKQIITVCLPYIYLLRLCFFKYWIPMG